MDEKKKEEKYEQATAKHNAHQNKRNIFEQYKILLKHDMLLKDFSVRFISYDQCRNNKFVNHNCIP